MSNLINDIPYEDLLALHTIYYNEPITFCHQILNVKPDKQQRDVITSLYNDPRKAVTVRSGRGAGKTWLSAMIIWHFLCTRYFAQVYVTAPTAATLQGALWPTIAKLNSEMHPLYKDQFEVLTSNIKHIEHPMSWFCMSRTARAENPDAMAGSHAAEMLYVVDEASGLSEEHFKAIFGSLTEENNYLLMLSNPRRITGPFYESHQADRASVFVQLVMNALKSEYKNQRSTKNIKAMYGVDSDAYRIEVLGEFPKREDGSIIPYDQVVEAIERNKNITYDDQVEYEAEEMVWGLDVSGGGADSSVRIRRRGRKVYKDIKKWSERDTMKIVGRVAKEYRECKPEDRPDKICVDNVAIGKGAFDRMRELKLPVVPCHASAKAKDYKFNKIAKAEWWSDMRDWFRDEKPILPNDDDLKKQVSTVRDREVSDGRFMVERKVDYKKRLPHIGSPDVADALAMTFSRKQAIVVGDDSITFM